MIELIVEDFEYLRYFHGKERFWEKDHHHLFGSRGTRKQTENSNSQIRKQEDYPEKYKNLIPKIEADNSRNIEFINILSKLKAHEMKQTNQQDTEIKKSSWYYLSKLKQKFQQRFPQKWKYNQ